ncbi:MAG: isochorismatase family cysteine hydrolase [Pyrinomonadaceae bacterium]
MENFDRPVLMVVDVQNGFLNQHSRHVIPNVVRLIHIFLERSLPIIFSRFTNVSGSSFETLVDWRRVYQPPETDLADEVSPFAKTVINKHFYSSLTSESVRLIQAWDAQTLILCGVATEACVLKTALDAFEMDLVPVVIVDACASDMGVHSHEAGVHVLKNLIGKRQTISLDELATRI